MTDTLHASWPEVRPCRVYVYEGSSLVNSYDNQMVVMHAVAVVDGTAAGKTVCGMAVDGEIEVEHPFTEKEPWQRCDRCRESLGLPSPPD